MWSFHCFDAATSASLGTVDMESWSHEDRLNDSGSWSAKMAVLETPQLERVALAATLEGRTVIVAVRTNQYGIPDILYSGFIPPGGRIPPDLAGAGLLSYFDLRVLNFTAAYAAVDQFALVENLIFSTQDDGPGINIDLSQVGVSGVPRDQTWNSWERKNIGEAIRQKAALINGFDFDIRTEYDAGSLVRRLRCWYPRRGRTVTSGGPVFTLNGNVTAISPAAGASSFHTFTHGLGAEINEVTRARLETSSTNAALLTAGWTVIDHVLNLQDISTLSVLEDHVDGHLARHAVQDADELTLDVDPDDAIYPLGSYETGDDCQVIIPAARPARIEITTAVDAYVDFPDTLGNVVTIARSLPGSITSLEFAVRVHSFDSAAFETFCGWQSTNAGFRRDGSSTGKLNIYLLNTAFNGIGNADSSVVTPSFTPGMWFRGKVTVSNAECEYWYSYDQVDDYAAVTWTSLGTPQIGTHAGTTPYLAAGGADTLMMGGNTTGGGGGNTMDGGLHGFVEVDNGTIAVEIRSTDLPAEPASTFTTTSGHTATVNRSGTPDTELVAPVLGQYRTVDPGYGVPWWPDGLNQVRRIVARKGNYDSGKEQFQVVTGRPLP